MDNIVCYGNVALQQLMLTLAGFYAESVYLTIDGEGGGWRVQTLRQEANAVVAGSVLEARGFLIQETLLIQINATENKWNMRSIHTSPTCPASTFLQRPPSNPLDVPNELHADTEAVS